MLTRVIATLCFTAAVFAQTPRVIHASVYTQNNKLVTGLEQNNFAVVENGVLRRLESFDHLGPVTTAVVGTRDFEAPARMQVLRAGTVPEALAQLAGVTGRKAIVVPPGADTAGVPGDVHIVIDPDPRHGLLVATNAYLLRYRSTDPAAPVQVVLADVDGLPPVSVRWQ